MFTYTYTHRRTYSRTSIYTYTDIFMYSTLYSPSPSTLSFRTVLKGPCSWWASRLLPCQPYGYCCTECVHLHIHTDTYAYVPSKLVSFFGISILVFLMPNPIYIYIYISFKRIVCMYHYFQMSCLFTHS